MVNFMLQYILSQLHVCFGCVCFSFSVLNQEIGWELPILCRVGCETTTYSI